LLSVLSVKGETFYLFLNVQTTALWSTSKNCESRPFNVKVGDIVKVDGRRSGQVGTVTEIDLFATAWSEKHVMQPVVRAYRAPEQA
jgi:hypothetical protein